LPRDSGTQVIGEKMDFCPICLAGQAFIKKYTEAFSVAMPQPIGQVKSNWKAVPR
jgi:hypothetical protein